MKDLVKSLVTSLLPFWAIINLNLLPFKIPLEQQGMPFEVFSGCLQFLMVRSFMEILILLYSMAKKKGIINTLRQSSSQGPEKRLFCEHKKLKLKKFILNAARMTFVSIIYYFVYVILFTVVSSACSLYIQQRIVVGPEISLQAVNRAGMDKSHIFDGLGNTRRQLGFESSPLSSTTGRFFSINISYPQWMVLSSDGDIAFVCWLLNDIQPYFLNIVNISSVESPNLLSSVQLTSSIDQLLSNDYSYSTTMLLSPDEQTLFMSSGPSIVIFNVSNLTSPSIVNLYTPSKKIMIIDSFVFMPDGKSVAMSIQNDEEDSYLIIANITDLLDPTLIYSSENFSDLDFPENEVYFDQGLLWIGRELTWQIYNASDLTQVEYIATLDASASIPDGITGSVTTFSSDYKTIYICYSGENSDLDYYSMFDITNVTAPTQYPITIPTWSSSYIDESFQAAAIAISPDNRLLFITGGDFLQIFDVSNLTSPVQLNNISVPFPRHIIISADGRRALVSAESQTYSVELYFNIPASQFSNLQNNVIGIINPYETPVSPEMVDSIVLSPNGDTLYVAALGIDPDDPVYFKSIYLEVLNVSDPNFINLTSYIGYTASINQIGVSPDGNILFIATEDSDGYSIIEIYSLESNEVLSSFFSTHDIDSFTISPDANTLFAGWSDTDEDDINWSIINVTNLTSPSQIGNFSYDDSDTFEVRMTISSDGNTAYLTGSVLRIMNISDLSAPTLISKYHTNGYTNSVTLSPDDQTAFLTTEDSSGEGVLEIVNISSLSAPTFISSINIPDDSDNTDRSGSDSDSETFLTNGAQLANISPDGKILFVVASGLIVLNVSNLAHPSFLSFFTVPAASSVQISPDYSTAFLTAFNQGVIVLQLKSTFLFHMLVTAFPLGKTGANTLNVLAINPNNTYDASLVNYKFIGLSLYSVDYEPGYASPVYNFTALPSWMDFDTATGTLTVSPNSNSQIGSYSLYGALSTCIENTAFLGVANTTTIEETTQLMIILIGLGYIDNEGFLTSAFDPDKPLVVGTQALRNETEIRNVMSEYYIEATTSISVIPSLSLTLGNTSSVDPKISIITVSLSPLNLQITLDNTNNVIAKFVGKDYPLIPSFTQDYKTISVVGSLFDINLVLSQLVIFLNDTNPCNGTITISDGLNYPLTQSITNISTYFSKSSQPSCNISYFQSQIDKVSIVTGDQFIIQFDYATFQDPDGEDLTYRLATQDSSTQVPDWLTLRGLDLIGTPPLQLNGRDIPLKIVASNQYQSIEAGFTLHVGISFMFVLKLVGEYGGGLITALGLIMYISQIYNVLCKRFYRYPIAFAVKFGEEITSRTIYPIAFVRDVLLESRFILKHLDRKITAEIQNSSKSEIANSFRLENTYQIDKVNLTQRIEEIVVELLSTKASNKLKLYVPGIKSRKELIDQLIFKEMTMRLIDLKEQKQTKMAFKSIRNNLFSLIEFKKSSKDGICEFCVVRSKLYEQLRIKNIAILSSTKNEESKTELSNTSMYSEVTEVQETPARMNYALLAVQPQEVDIDLLVDVIEGYTFKYHNLDSNLLDIKIQVKEQMKYVSPPRIIKKFLKMDLTEINFVCEKKQLGYGLQYETGKGFLRFCGEPDYDIKGRTLVIQITNIKGRILREIWVNGIDNEAESESLKESLIL